MSFEATELVNQIIRPLRPKKNLQDNIAFSYPNLSINNQTIDVSRFEKVHFIGIGQSSYYEIETILNIFKDIPLKNIGKKIIFTNNSPKKVFAQDLEVIIGDQPLLTQNNIEKTNLLISEIDNFNENDLILFTISNGTSSLIELLPNNISFDDYQMIQEKFISENIHSKEINEMINCISMIKNGGLIAHCPCDNIVAFVSNQITNDDNLNPLPSPLYYKKQNTDKIYDNFSKLNLPSSVINNIKDWFNSVEYENLQLDKRVKQTSKNILIQNTIQIEKLKESALRVMESIIQKDQIDLSIPTYKCKFDELIQNEVTRIANSNKKAFISSGQATLNITDQSGLGGRNTHFCAYMAYKIFKENVFNLTEDQIEKSWVLSFATDGDDTKSGIAGGYLNHQAFNKKLDSFNAIKNFDTGNFLKSVDGTIEFASMGINLMDLRIIYIDR